MGSNIILLLEDTQRRMNLSLVNNLPWNSFGRKNIGYLYAISQGAEVIFDFDDDNMLKFWMKGASPDPVMDIDNFSQRGSNGTLSVTVQHITYAYLDANDVRLL